MINKIYLAVGYAVSCLRNTRKVVHYYAWWITFSVLCLSLLQNTPGQTDLTAYLMDQKPYSWIVFFIWFYFVEEMIRKIVQYETIRFTPAYLIGNAIGFAMSFVILALNYELIFQCNIHSLKGLAVFVFADLILAISVSLAGDLVPTSERNINDQGTSQAGISLTEQERQYVAYHEAGHAITATILQVGKTTSVSIRPANRSLGNTVIEAFDSHLATRQGLKNRIAVYVAGRAAEEITFKEILANAEDDIHEATRLARTMISRYGMSEEFWMVAMLNESHKKIPESQDLVCAPNTNEKIDTLVAKLVREQYIISKELLNRNKEALNKIANRLIEYETISGQEVESILATSERS